MVFLLSFTLKDNPNGCKDTNCVSTVTFECNTTQLKVLLKRTHNSCNWNFYSHYYCNIEYFSYLTCLNALTKFQENLETLFLKVTSAQIYSPCCILKITSTFFCRIGDTNI